MADLYEIFVYTLHGVVATQGRKSTAGVVLHSVRVQIRTAPILFDDNFGYIVLSASQLDVIRYFRAQVKMDIFLCLHGSWCRQINPLINQSINQSIQFNSIPKNT